MIAARIAATPASTKVPLRVERSFCAHCILNPSY
jgi:hypothetical protein